MSKAEKFIKDCTRNCSNEYWGNSKSVGQGGTISKRGFTPWLTPDQAKRAVEIAKEEIYEWLKEHADTYTWYNEFKGESGMTEDFIDDLKQVMTDE